MLLLSATLNRQSALFTTAVDDGFERTNLAATVVPRGQRAEVPPATGRAATEASEIHCNIMLLYHKIVPSNISNALFFDYVQHLNQHLDFIPRIVALCNAVSDIC
jgi:hypothetical protein